MKKETNLTTGISEPEVVDDYMNKLKHPMADVVQYIRTLILTTDKKIGEGIFWNGPTFYYTGKMKPFNPKEYKRYIVGINMFKKDCIRLIFLSGAKLNDTFGLLEGEYTDGRRLVLFYDLEDVKGKEKMLQKLIKKWIKMVE